MHSRKFIWNVFCRTLHRWRLKSPASRLFTQTCIQTQIKENIKAPRHWPLLCGEFTGTGEFPAQRASYAENVSIWWRHHDIDHFVEALIYWIIVVHCCHQPFWNLVNRFWGNGLSHVLCQAIIWTTAALLSIGLWGTKLSENSVKMRKRVLETVVCKMTAILPRTPSVKDLILYMYLVMTWWWWSA